MTAQKPNAIFLSHDQARFPLSRLAWTPGLVFEADRSVTTVLLPDES